METIIINEPIDSNILLSLSPLYRDSVGTEDNHALENNLQWQ